jgi:5-formyltetrahydrofolate cyclo-ligase
VSAADEKTALRRRLRERRRELKTMGVPAEERVVDVWAARDEPPPQVAAFYVALGSELDPRTLSSWFAGRGVRICLPVVVGPAQPLVFREVTDEGLHADALDLPCPPVHAPLVRPELIFVPLLGFDLTGARLGQGGGYYDRTLAALRAAGPPVRAIGLAYAGQQVDRLPTDGFDQRLDGVLTETAYLEFTGDRPPMPTTPAS